MMNDQTVGTCSLCGGAVTVPSVWMGIIPPTPTCVSCGATAVENHGPVIPMQRPRYDTRPRLGTSTSAAGIVFNGSVITSGNQIFARPVQEESSAEPEDKSRLKLPTAVVSCDTAWSFVGR